MDFDRRSRVFIHGIPDRIKLERLSVERLSGVRFPE
jgi:hypothetical protein